MPCGAASDGEAAAAVRFFYCLITRTQEVWVANDMTVLAGWLAGSRGHHVSMVCCGLAFKEKF